MATQSNSELQEQPEVVKSFTYVQSKPIEELFDMVYKWGQVGIVVDSTAPAFQDKLMEVVRSIKCN